MIKKILILVFKLAVSAALLYYLLTKIALTEILQTIGQADPVYVIWGFLVSPLDMYLSACQLRIVLKIQKIEVSVLKITLINFMTCFYGIFLPGLLAGGAVRWYKISAHTDKRAEVFAALVFNRFFFTATMVVIGLVVWFLDSSNTVGDKMGLAMGAALLLMGAAYLLLFHSALALNLKNKIEIAARIPGWIRGKLVSLLDATIRFRTISAGNFFRLLFLALLRHLVGIFSMYMFALALNIEISFITLCWVRSLLFFVLLVPITFSGIGVREGTLLFVLRAYGVSAVSVVGLSFLMLARNLTNGMVGGIIELVSFLSKRKAGK